VLQARHARRLSWDDQSHVWWMDVFCLWAVLVVQGSSEACVCVCVWCLCPGTVVLTQPVTPRGDAMGPFGAASRCPLPHLHPHFLMLCVTCSAFSTSVTCVLFVSGMVCCKHTNNLVGLTICIQTAPREGHTTGSTPNHCLCVQTGTCAGACVRGTRDWVVGACCVAACLVGVVRLLAGPSRL
jgi:hypothetical protein